jgi:hypothetical protein
MGASEGKACPFTATGSVPAVAGNTQAVAKAAVAIRVGRRRRAANIMMAPRARE